MAPLTAAPTPARTPAPARRPRWLAVASAVMVMALVSACGGASTRTKVGKAADILAAIDTKATVDVSSPVLRNGERIPARFTCDGTGISPAITWSGVPAEGVELAVVLDDRDAGATFVHWVLFDVDPASGGVPEDAVPAGAHQARNSKTSGYNGPCPPKGSEHNYRLSVYALDEAMPSTLGDGADLLATLEALHERAIAKGQMNLVYSR